MHKQRPLELGVFDLHQTTNFQLGNDQFNGSENWFGNKGNRM